MTTRIVTDANGRKHITNEPLLHPPKRELVGLTDEEFQAIAIKYSLPTFTGLMYFKDEIEAKLKEKNT